MIRRKPERAVDVLLRRLNMVKTRAPEIPDNYRPSSKLIEEIADKLESMTNLYRNIKFVEDTVTDQFCKLEQQLYDYHENFEKQENDGVVLEKVGLLENLGKLKEMIEKQVAEIDTSDLSKTSNKREQSADPALPQNKEIEAKSKEWEKINLEIEEKISQSEAMSSLLASFRSLEKLQLKMCLMCLSIFPENSVIMKRPIIYWWIGEGIVTKKGEETAEEVGEQVFRELLNQGFIKRSSEDNSSITVKSFVVHPWIRRMLILAAKENNFLKFSPDGKPLSGLRRAFSCGGDKKDTRRQSGMDEDPSDRDNHSGPGNEKDLLTVFNVEDKYLGIKSEQLRRLEKVGVLQLGRWRNSPKYHIEVGKQKQDELLKGLGPQKHLKYLSLRGISLIETLPDSIGNLFSLEILDLRACHNLYRLPQAVTELKNLTHLDVSECYLLESMPKGFESLHALQVLKGFVIGKEWKNSCRIRDLSGLRKLRKLSIRVGSNDDEAQGQLSQFDHFPALRILTISWGVISSKPSPLTFPGSLTKLHLRCAPKWIFPIELPNLEKLYITGIGLTSASEGLKKGAPEERNTTNAPKELDIVNLVSAPNGLKTVKFLRFEYLKGFRNIADESELLRLFPEYRRCEIVKCDGISRTFVNSGGKAISLSPTPSNS